MDDIFDNLIYIVIMIVAFVISALGKKKKKQVSRPSPIIGNEPYIEKKKGLLPDLERLIRDEMGLDEQNIYNNYITDDEEARTEITSNPENEILDSVPKHMLDDKEDIPYSIEYEDTSEIFKSSIENSDITKSNTEEESDLKDFNLQEAIIYSEIINRKYI